jgi:hypothetical protein
LKGNGRKTKKSREIGLDYIDVKFEFSLHFRSLKVIEKNPPRLNVEGVLVWEGKLPFLEPLLCAGLHMRSTSTTPGFFPTPSKMHKGCNSKI